MRIIMDNHHPLSCVQLGLERVSAAKHPGYSGSTFFGDIDSEIWIERKEQDITP